MIPSVSDNSQYLSHIAMPAGQMPVLEVDGVQIGQSVAIARFLANKYNLAGNTPLEKAQADMMVDCTQDFLNGKYIGITNIRPNGYLQGLQI